MDILNRFLKYISIPTNSSSNAQEVPSTNSQKVLAELLVLELKELGISEVYYDEKYCYVYAVLRGKEELPKIGFISHIDTAEDVTDVDIKPKVIHNYDGNNIVLNENILLKVSDYPDLSNHKGKTIITTGGLTLLGADDKAGIAEIMEMLKYFCNSEEQHGDVYVAFTPDEEIGNETNYFDFSRFKADFAYTVDGSDLGEISYENFNAATVKIEITGISTHWGSAKDIMVNSSLIANEIINLLPKELPENTEGYDGFYHLEYVTGSVSNTQMQYRIRDFDVNGFEERKQKFETIVEHLNKKYNNCITLKITDSYYNMKDIISKNMHLIENAKIAMGIANVTPIIKPIRGGTDGAELTYKGLPCPNLGTGGHNFHSIYEYICVEDMKKVRDVLIELVKLYGKSK